MHVCLPGARDNNLVLSSVIVNGIQYEYIGVYTQHSHTLAELAFSLTSREALSHANNIGILCQL